MKIPKKITPDRIKQAVVEVKYKTEFLHEISLGMFFNALDETYSYTNRPTGIQNNSIIKNIDPALTLMEGMENFSFPPFPMIGQSIFFNDKIKIQLRQNSIVFNCLNEEYISWGIYEQEIEKTLSQLLKAKVIQVFTGVGIRYTSHYPEIDLKDCVKFSFTFGMPDIVSNSYSFKCEFNYGEHMVLINLHNKMAVFDSKLQYNQLVPTSVIDIDVIDRNLNVGIDNIKDVMGYVSITHQKEKEIFFNILKEDFLQSLNPVY